VTNARSEIRPIALSVLAVHLLLVGGFGHQYAKLKLGFGGISIYPTELVVLLVTLTSLRSIINVPRDTITKLVVAFVVMGVGWVGLAGLGSLDGAGAKAFSFFIYSALYFVVRSSARDEQHRNWLLRVVALASVIGAAIGIWQVITGAPLFDAVIGSADGFEETSTGSFRWLSGEFALYGLLGTMIVGVGAIIRRHITRLDVGLFACASIEIVLAQHRSGFVAFAVALGVTAVFLGGSAQTLKRLFKLLIMVVIAFVIFASIFGGSYIDDTINRIGHSADTNDVNIEWRLLSWYEVFDAVRDRPFGHGFSTWEFLFTAADPLTGSHNSFLDLCYRVGIEGLVLLLAMPFVLLKRTRSIIAKTGAEAHVPLITVCACMIAFLIYASFNVVLETPYMSIYFWVLLGIGASYIGQQNAGSVGSAKQSAQGGATT
jgi:O-antigen ligase